MKTKHRATWGLDLKKEVKDYSSERIGTIEFAWGNVTVSKGGKDAWKDAQFVASIESTDGCSTSESFADEDALLEWLNKLHENRNVLNSIILMRMKNCEKMKPLQMKNDELGDEFFREVSK